MLREASILQQFPAVFCQMDCVLSDDTAFEILDKLQQPAPPFVHFKEHDTPFLAVVVENAQRHLLASVDSLLVVDSSTATLAPLRQFEAVLGQHPDYLSKLNTWIDQVVARSIGPAIVAIDQGCIRFWESTVDWSDCDAIVADIKGDFAKSRGYVMCCFPVLLHVLLNVIFAAVVAAAALLLLLLPAAVAAVAAAVAGSLGLRSPFLVGTAAAFGDQSTVVRSNTKHLAEVNAKANLILAV